MSELERQGHNLPDSLDLEDQNYVFTRFVMKLEESRQVEFDWPEYMEHRDRVFTFAISYGKYIYPNVFKFLRNVRTLMSAIVRIDKIEIFEARRKKLDRDCKKCKREGAALESDHDFAIGIFARESRNLVTYQDELKKQAKKLTESQEGRSALGKIWDIFDHKTISLKKEYAIKLDSASKHIKDLNDCCLRVQDVVKHVNKMLLNIGFGIDDVNDHLSGATDLKNDEITGQYILDEIKDTAQKLLPILIKFLHLKVDVFPTLSALEENGLSISAACEWRHGLREAKRSYLEVVSSQDL